MKIINSISFNKDGHDSFLDFVKAYAILGVLICHTVYFINKVPGYGLFFGIDVPIFLLIQAFHFHKKEKPKLKLWKIIKRVFIPFFIIQLVILIITYITDKQLFMTNWPKWVYGFGRGPGSYYPLVYLQFAILLFAFRFLFQKLPRKKLLLLFLLFAEAYEIICSLIQPSSWVYRLLVFRYVFIVFLGWIWVIDGVIINWKTILLSILSMVSVCFFLYYPMDLEPMFYNSAWTFAKWPCYYWLASGFIMVLYFFWRRFQKIDKINKLIAVLAKSSWEIYLMQMATISLIKESIFNLTNNTINYALWCLLIWVLSIVGGVLLNKIFVKIIY